MAGYYWYPSKGEIPLGAVRAGIDRNDSDLLVGRAYQDGYVEPGKVVANERAAFISYGGGEVRKTAWEVLCRGGTSVTWQKYSGGSIHPNAVVGGMTSSNEPLYIGRGSVDGMFIPGKVVLSQGLCYVPYDGRELTFVDFEVLLLN